ncbi:MAG: alpha/beta hydrolase [Hyphomicrobiales bacterium]|nr:MAG: alpha/beta hydrolase [Hyphomicrobiales bacterium]
MTNSLSIRIGAATLPAIEAGPADGIPVIFLHAGVCDHRMWAAQVAAVAAEGYRAIAYTRRGFGAAQSPDEPFSHLDDLEALLTTAGIHAAVLVGCSMGGGLAIDFALRHPGRTVGLVLSGTAITGGDYLLSDTDQQMSDVLDDAEERGDPEFQNKADAHAWLDGPRSANGRVTGAVRELFFDMNAKALANGPSLTQEQQRPSARDRVGQIGAPALLVAGDLDFNYILTRHEGLSDELPNAFATIIEGTAHLPNLERPELFNPLLLEFLSAATQ